MTIFFLCSRDAKDEAVVKDCASGKEEGDIPSDLLPARVLHALPSQNTVSVHHHPCCR